MITLNGKPASTTSQPAAPGRRRQSRYRSECKCCGKIIDVGHWVVPHNGTAGRPRWKHEDCDNVPAIAAVGVAGEDSEARRMADDARSLAANLRNEVAALRNKLAEVEAATPRKIIVEQPATKTKVVIEEKTHPAFERVLRLAARRKNIFLPGPTGCGKTHLAAQVAKALKLKFAMVSCSAGMSEGQLNGRLLPVGKAGTFEYVISEFVKLYETGGVFLLDEIDAADANVLLVINAALANGHMPVPNRPAKPTATRHKDFICLAAANTWGTGADRMYVGRNQLDGATLDRFLIGCVPMDYDEALERSLVADDELFDRLLTYRKNIRANKLMRAMSTRFMLDARDMRKGADGFTLEEIDEAFFSGWRSDEISKVKGY